VLLCAKRKVFRRRADVLSNINSIPLDLVPRRVSRLSMNNEDNSAGLHHSVYRVRDSLIFNNIGKVDMDSNSSLYATTSFECLGMYVQ
jgi:hypothetical protein